MQPPDDPTSPALHPVRESVGFLSATLSALARLFWPAHRRATSGEEQVVGEAEPVRLPLADKPAHLGPYPIDD